MRAPWAIVLAGLAFGGCVVTEDAGGGGEPAARAAGPGAGAPTSTTAAAPEATTTTAVAAAPTTTPPSTTPRPGWLGTRVLPTGPDGFGEVGPTPPELTDRRFATVDALPPPATDSYRATVEAVPAAVAARSTWDEACPVGLDELRYVTVPFWGFDERLHTGELLVHADAVDATVAGFARLFDRRFPIESMRITSAEELQAPITGDGNNTSAFVCRPTRGSTRWSEHAHGRAIDINPFHNPYVKDDLVLPELASAYADREDHRPGMLTAQDVSGFKGRGWGWGSEWSSTVDHMHVSAGGT